MCSSGTTGLPKGVQLSHNNVIAAAATFISNKKAMNVDEEEAIILGIIPWFHAFGCLTIVGTCLSNTLLVSLPKFEEFLFLTIIEVSYARMVFERKTNYFF